MAFRKVDCVSQFDYTTQKVGPGSEALDDAGDLLPAGAFAPEVIGRSGLAGGFSILDDPDLGRGFRWLWVVSAVGAVGTAVVFRVSHTCQA